MRKISALLICVLGVFGCDESIEDKDLGTGPRSDLKCSSLPDLAPPPAKCAAAKGLSGDVLGNLCVDFSAFSDQTLSSTPPQGLTGWTFGKDGMNNDCWQVMGGKLLVKDFTTFMSSCNFRLPALSAADYNKYSSFTLSVVQTININPAKQNAFIYMGAEMTTQQIWNVTGAYGKMDTMLQIAKTDLPNGGTGTYQPLFKIISSVAGGGFEGWQIESIAVTGNQ